MCLNDFDRKFVPWSVCTTLGRPDVVKNLISALLMAGAMILHRGTVSGKRVDMHIIGNKYWLPVFVLGNGPTQSTMACSNSWDWVKRGRWHHLIQISDYLAGTA